MTSSADSLSLLNRLASRGIGRREYSEIQVIVKFSLPQSMLYFQSRFPRNSPAQVLKQLESWRQFLQTDFVLTDDEKQQLEINLTAYESATWLAIVDRFVSLNEPWRVRAVWLKDAKGKYLKPRLQVTATPTAGGKPRIATIPSESLSPPNWWDGWKRALTELGLLKFARNEGYQVSKLFSKRKPQGWALFTQVVIPRLYEFMAPFYAKPGRTDLWEDYRNAFQPAELLKDMLALLRDAHPEAFASYTTIQLKARIQEHIRKKQEAELSRGKVPPAER